MEYFGYVICIFLAYFSFRIGWKIFGKTLPRWQRHRMSESAFMQKRLAYSIALAFIFGGIPAYIIFSYTHPNHKDSFMNLNKKQEKPQPQRSLEFIDEGAFQTPQKTSEEESSRGEEEEQILNIQEKDSESKIENESEDEDTQSYDL